MRGFPFALLTRGYGLAAAAGLALWVGGGGWIAALVLCWLGGAAATLAFGALDMRGRAGRLAAVPEHDANVALAAELALWEQDRLADSAGAASPLRRAAAD
jgi:hypothetical protein